MFKLWVASSVTRVRQDELHTKATQQRSQTGSRVLRCESSEWFLWPDRGSPWHWRTWFGPQLRSLSVAPRSLRTEHCGARTGMESRMESHEWRACALPALLLPSLLQVKEQESLLDRQRGTQSRVIFFMTGAIWREAAMSSRHQGQLQQLREAAQRQLVELDQQATSTTNRESHSTTLSTLSFYTRQQFCSFRLLSRDVRQSCWCRRGEPRPWSPGTLSFRHPAPTAARRKRGTSLWEPKAMACQESPHFSGLSCNEDGFVVSDSVQRQPAC